MCGIAGTLRFDGAPAAAPDLSPLRHRGPDGEAHHRSRDASCALSLCRLAIVRPELPAHAPRDGALVAVATGEIYDHRARGGGGIDTDLVPTLCKRQGTDWLRTLRGPLACAVHDEEARTLTLLRDAVGKRPLYYRQDARSLRFATEQKALVGGDVALDPRYVAEVLAWGRSSRTACRGVVELLPGQGLEARVDGRVRCWQADLLEPGPRSTSAQCAALLEEAIALRLPEQVSAACAVGGMDSQLVAAGARRPCFTLDADAAESADAAATLGELGLPHELVSMGRPDRAGLRRALWFLESVDDAACWQMAPALLSLTERVRAAGHKVLFIGEGADEIFLGYPWRPQGPTPPPVPTAMFSQGRALMLDDAWRGRMEAMRLRARHLLASDPTALWQAEAIAELCGQAPADGAVSAVHAGSAAVAADAALLPLDARRRAQLEELRVEMHLLPVLHADRLAFANGVETRAPFLDRRLIDCALGLPEEELSAADGTEKPVVRGLYRARFRREPRRKRGFTGVARPPAVEVEALAREWLERGPRTVDAAALGALVAQPEERPGRTTLLWRVVLLEELEDVLRGGRAP